MKCCSSSQLAIAGAQPWRDTTRAPQALAQAQQRSERLVLEPAAQEARHEGVARAQHVEHLDREARALEALFDAGSGIAPSNTTQPMGPRLTTSVAWRQRAQALQRLQRVGAAAGDVDFLFGAHHQVAFGDHGLQMRADLVDGTKRCSPMPGLVRPHSTGR